MFRNRLIIFFPIFLLATNVMAQNVQSQLKLKKEIYGEIDRVENELSSDIRSHTERLMHLEGRFSKLSDSFGEIKATRDNVDEKYEKILHIEARMSEFQAKVDTIASLKSKVDGLDNSLLSVKSDIRSSQDIVTWVTLIVTVVVILIGLFFSKLFLDLYANYKVLSDRFAYNRAQTTSWKESSPDQKAQSSSNG